MQKGIKLALLSAVCLLFTGCEMVDSQMLTQLQEYFPLAELTHPDPQTLAVDTHLTNLTEKFAKETFSTLLRTHCCHGGLQGIASYDLDQIFPMAGYNRLVVKFDKTVCGWYPAKSQVFICSALGSMGREYRTYSIVDQNNIFLNSQPPIGLQPAQPTQPSIH